jgi:hypothetical protein
VTLAGALVMALGVVWIVVSARISRAYSGNQRIFRAFTQFGGVMFVVVGAMWMAGIGTK